MWRMPRISLCLWVFMPVVIWLLAACSHDSGPVSEPVYHCDAYDIAPDSVDMHTGVILRANGDSAIQVRVEGNVLRTVYAGAYPRSRGVFRYKSDYPVFDALLRIETSRASDDNYTLATPYELYLNPFIGADGERMLDSRIRNGYLIPSDTRRYGWPVINDNPQWILAACELFKITANRVALETTGRLAANIATEERKVCMNGVTGLIGGIPRYMAAPKELFPEWVGPGELFEIATFSVNMAWWAALKSMADITAGMALRNEMARLPEMPLDPDSLRNAMFRYFWNPAEGRFSAMIYGDSFRQLPLGASDNLAQGLAIITGLPITGMAEMMVSKTPASVTGISLLSPCMSTNMGNTPYEELARAVWAIAASRAGNDKVYNAAVGALIYNLCNDILGSRHVFSAMKRPLASLVLRGFCGISTAFEGLYFSPCVPSCMPGTKHVDGLKYRRSELSITINGTGSKIVSFTVDGKETKPFYPASEEGSHEIVITLSGEVGIAEADFSDPGVITDAPTVECATLQDRSFFLPDAGGDGEKRMVYINGIPAEEIAGRYYSLDTASVATTVQFCMVKDDHWPGFATAPYLYLPTGCVQTVPMADVALKGNRIIEDKDLATRFIESTRYKNNKIAFDVTVEEKGVYGVDVHYVNGLGIVNPRRRTALRRLSVDGDHKGIFVFTQLSPVDWDNDPMREWQMMTGFTNPLKVGLDPGTHRFELRYYQPNPVYIDPFSNTVVADYVRIVRYE